MSHLLARGPLSPQNAVAIVAGVAAAVETLERHGLVPRELSPDQILVDGERGALLVDFALPPDLMARRKPGANSVYRAPEDRNGHAPDERTRTSVYSLGAVLSAALTGKPPPGAPSPRRDLPPAFEPVITRAMASEPNERYANVIDMGRAAVAALGSSTAEHPPPQADRNGGPAAPRSSQRAKNGATRRRGHAAEVDHVTRRSAHTGLPHDDARHEDDSDEARRKQAAADAQREAAADQRKREAAEERKRKAAEEQKRRAAAERKREAAEERKREAAEERKRKAAAERERKAVAEREHKAVAEREHKKAEERDRQAREAVAQKAERERREAAAAAQKAQQDEERERREAAAAARKAQQDEERERREAATAAQKAELAKERQRKKAEAAAQKAELAKERQRKKVEAAAQKAKQAEERKRKAAAERRRKEAAERKRKAAQERQRKAAETAARKRKQTDERERKAPETAERHRVRATGRTDPQFARRALAGGKRWAKERRSLAPLALVVLVTATAAGLALPRDSHEESPAAAVRIADLGIELPAGWERTKPTSGRFASITELVTGTLVARPADGADATLMAGVVRDPVTTRRRLGRLLPDGTKPAAGRLGELDVTRYPLVRTQQGTVATVYLANTTGPSALVLCEGSADASSRSLQACAKAASTVSIRGERSVAVTLQQRAGFERAALQKLATERLAARSRVAVAVVADDQAAASGSLEASYLQAAGRVELSGMYGPTTDALLRALRAAGAGYGDLATAIREGDQDAYNAARAAVLEAETQIWGASAAN